MRAELLTDELVIAETIRNPKIYPYVSDDGSPAPADLKPPMGLFSYLAIFDGDEYLGLFALHPHSVACWEVHTCLLPAAWGRRAIEAAQTCIAWVFQSTSCQRLITSVPRNNPLALRLARKAGMAEYGLNPRSWLKDGVLHDQILLGISKEEPCQSQE